MGCACAPSFIFLKGDMNFMVIKNKIGSKVRMDPFPTSVEKLTWIKSREKPRSYVLGDGAREYATIIWPRTLSDQAVGEWSVGRIIIQRKGILHSVVRVIGGDLEQEMARMPWTLGKEAKVDFNDGRSYLIQKHGLWNDRWTLSKEDETQIIELKPAGIVGTKGEVKVEKAEGVQDNLPILAILLWYDYVIATRETVAVIASVGRGV
jgi:hypothetical protein